MKFCNASQERCEIIESHKNRKFDYDLGHMTCIRKLIVLELQETSRETL